jgi:hypothetical protein
MKTHEQLTTLIGALEVAGWVRVNGNTWQSPHKAHMLRTAYTYQEATLELYGLKRNGQRNNKGLTYRGAEPLTWVKTGAAKVLGKVLDTVAAPE